ncbi:MAG: aminotransferase class V-fold PLP-dependent enzyme [Clostridia bacterium]|nr:aminotransferase class V-fold PLP-dependent enzyme [Clostridia bacterium]
MVPRPNISTPEAFRAHFPIFLQRVHLASCSQGAVSLDALQALDDYRATLREDGAAWDRWMAQVEAARRAFARLIGASPEEVAIVPSASAGAAAVASALFPGAPDSTRRVIVTSDLEFPSIAHVWLAQRSRRGDVRFVRSENGIIDAARWAEAIGPDTRLVSAHTVTFTNGARNDLDAIVRRAHEAGALVFADAYQGAGVVPIDVRRTPVDFLVAGALKYLLAVPGIAFLYVRAEVAESLFPSVTGWFGQRDPYAFDPFTLEPAPAALRFQGGTPAVPAAYAAAASIGLIASVGVERIWAHVQRLAARLTDRLRAAGVPLFSPLDAKTRGPQVAALVPNPEATAQALAREGFVVSPRGRAVRISLHYYNTDDDIDGVADALTALVRATSA